MSGKGAHNGPEEYQTEDRRCARLGPGISPRAARKGNPQGFHGCQWQHGGNKLSTDQHRALYDEHAAQQNQRKAHNVCQCLGDGSTFSEADGNRALNESKVL